MKRGIIIFLAILLISSVSASIIINEFESNSADGNEWVELYNPTDKPIDINGWELWDSLTTSKLIKFSEETIINNYSYFIYETSRLNNGGDKVILKDSSEKIVDETPILKDEDGNNLCWARFPNSQDTNTEEDWNFQTCTKAQANTPFPDLNNDCVINILDMILMRNNLDDDIIDENKKFDLNNDDKINILDLVVIRNNLYKIKDCQEPDPNYQEIPNQNQTGPSPSQP